MTRKLVFTPDALADLDQIFLYIAGDSPRRAETYVEEIVEKCHRLCETPMMGIDRSDLRTGLRVLPLWRRIAIAYELPDNRVDILRIFAGRRDYQALLRSE